VFEFAGDAVPMPGHFVVAHQTGEVEKDTTEGVLSDVVFHKSQMSFGFSYAVFNQ
jgi:hypothetical protein